VVQLTFNTDERIMSREQAAGRFAFPAKRDSQDRRLGYAAVKPFAA
jgi:hypothetical protein